MLSRRVAPREFAGLMLLDDERLLAGSHRGNFGSRQVKKYLTERILEIEQSLRNKLHLPIYGTSGDLLWPRPMRHDEIVQSLRERQA